MTLVLRHFDSAVVNVYNVLTVVCLLTTSPPYTDYGTSLYFTGPYNEPYSSRRVAQDYIAHATAIYRNPPATLFYRRQKSLNRQAIFCCRL